MQPPVPSVVPPREKVVTKVEWALAILGLIVLAVLKWLYIPALQVNSDEPQHLHVAWAWTQGLVQYRDIFDNHTPLFHILSAPFVAWLGERADILLYMRLAMVPIFIGSLSAIYLITRRLYDHRAALWAAIFAGLHPFYLLISTEYRTDNFWALSWFIALVWMLTGKATAKRFFIAGIFLGAAFSVSMKTSLLLLSFGIAAALVWAARIWAGEKGLPKLLAKNGLAMLAGAAIIPAILFAYFASQNALDALYYCVFEHNFVAGMKPKGNMDRWNFPLILPFILIAGWFYYHTAPNRYIGSRRAIALMGAAFSMSLLMAYWPLVTRQDFAAITPPFLISIAPLIMEIVRRLRKSGQALIHQGIRPRGWALVVASLMLPIAVIAYEVEQCDDTWRWTNEGLETFENRLRPKLELSQPGDYIFDAKGETIFRRRSYYYVLERVTLTRLKRDLMENTIREDILSKNTTTISMSRIPRTIQNEIDDCYLRVVGATWVAGQMLEKDEENADAPLRFQIHIPNRYSFVTEDGPIEGTLDGKAVIGPVELDKGKYQFVPSTPTEKQIAVLLSHSVEEGHTPFNVPPKEKHSSKDDGPRQVILTNPFSKKKIRD